MSKKHFWIRQIRRPLCFIIVLSIVAIYCISGTAYAYLDTGNQNFIDRFGIDTTQQDYVFYYRYGKASYDAEGHNSSNLFSFYQNPIRTGWAGSVGSWWFTWFDSFTYPSNVTIDGVTYDLNNAYIIANTSDSWVDNSGRGVKYVISDGKCAIADAYVVSESPFHFIYADSGGSTRVVNVTSAEQSGLYMLYLPTYAFGNADYTIAFTSLDVYMSSSDGESGYTTLTTSSTDLDLSSTDLYNFNNLKRDGIIINSGDPNPDPEPVFEPKGQFYNYCYVDGAVNPISSSSYDTHLRFSFNEYMRTHPDEFVVRVMSFATLYMGNNSTPSFKYNHEFPLTYVTNKMSHFDSDNSVYSYNINFSNLTDTGGTSVSQYLQNLYVQYGGNSSLYNSDSIITWDVESQLLNNFLGVPNLKITTGKWKIQRSFATVINKIQITETINIIWVGGEPETSSGTYSFKYDSETGLNEIVRNDIVNNYNPPEVNDPQYPSSINGSGGTTNTNPIYNYTDNSNSFNAMVEYLFNLDTSDLNNITGNIANNYQYVLNKVSDTSANGFWGVLKSTYDLIPEPIWTWLKVAVGVILGSCTYQWVINGVRIRR